MTYEDARTAYREGRIDTDTFLRYRQAEDARLSAYDEESGATALAAQRAAQWAAEDAATREDGNE